MASLTVCLLILTSVCLPIFCVGEPQGFRISKTGTLLSSTYFDEDFNHERDRALTRPRRQTEQRFCKIPNSLENGHWFYSNTAELAFIKCDDGYLLSSSHENMDFLVCNNDGMWNSTEIPTCESALLSSTYFHEDSNNERDRILTRPHRQTEQKSCQIPSSLKNGHWFYSNTAELAFIKCNDGYLLSSSHENMDFSVCNNDGMWNSTDIPTCEKSCPPFYNTSEIIVICMGYGTNKRSPCDKAIDGDLLTYQCGEHYTPASPGHSILQCLNGSWNYTKLPLCVPECGKANEKLGPLINGGVISQLGKYPWVVALYRYTHPQYENICGGSILTRNLVLTAAHCVSKEENGLHYDARYFYIAARKFYNIYYDARENGVQYSKVAEIIAHSEYKGPRQNFRSDIAILRLRTSLVLNDYVAPVCYQPLKQNVTGIMGKVAGWGYTTSWNKPSDSLIEVSLPIKDRHACYKEFDEEWADEYFTEEKLCAGYINASTSVCRGDSGSGLVVKHSDSKKYFVYGVVSLAHPYRQNNTVHCNIQRSALYTNVSYYSEWLQETIDRLSCHNCEDTKLALSTPGCNFCSCSQQFCPTISKRSNYGSSKLRSNESSCITPPQPKYGYWINLSTREIGVPGQKVPSSFIMTYYCDKGYLLKSDDLTALVFCTKDGWNTKKLPICQNLCPPIYDNDHYTVSCISSGGSVVPCDKATDHTMMTFKCEPYFEKAPGLEDSIYCVNGTWENTPKCVQVCGKIRIRPEVLRVNGQRAERGSNFPWTIALYSSEDWDPYYMNICGGSLLATNVVLTAAICVTKKETGEIIRKEVFRVAAGKYYNDFEDTRDTDTAQFSEIEIIVVPDGYRGEVQNYKHNIALLKLETNLILSEVVQPVCFKDLPVLPALKSNAEGWLAGWGDTKINGKSSDTLKEVQLTSVPFQQCSSELPPLFAQIYMTPEKICARLLNNNTILCKGDAGGGLVFRSKEYKNRFFVHGVSSLAVGFVKNQEIQCDVESPILFTNVGKYYHWIRDTVVQWTNDI